MTINDNYSAEFEAIAPEDTHSAEFEAIMPIEDDVMELKRIEAKLDAFSVEAMNRLQGKSQESDGVKDPFKFLGSFERLNKDATYPGTSLAEALDNLHNIEGGSSTVNNGHFRATVGDSMFDIINNAQRYDGDVWSQRLTCSGYLLRNKIVRSESSYSTRYPEAEANHKYRRHTYIQEFTYAPADISDFDNHGAVRTFCRRHNANGWTPWYDVENPCTESRNYGKKIALFGGSFAQNMAVDSADYKFVNKGRSYNLVDYLAEKIGAVVFDDYAVGGQGMRCDENTPFPVHLCRQLETAVANDNYDVYIIMGGLNDYGNDTPVGDSAGYPAGAEGVTPAQNISYCGGLRKAFDFIRVKSPSAAIYTMTPFKGYNENYGDALWNPRTNVKNGQGNTFYEFVQAQKETAQIVGVPCLDLWAMQGFSGANASANYISDLVHPNGRGYQKVADKILNLLATGVGNEVVDVKALASRDMKAVTKQLNTLAADVTALNNTAVKVSSKEWAEFKNINSYTDAGNYAISGERYDGDNLPILNNGTVNARLTVLVAENCVTQVLTLLNVAGGEGNVYIRTKQGDTWKPWGKLQTNVEVGQITPDGMSNLIDNGIYSGVCVDGETVETFVLIVINNYLAATQESSGAYVSQLKYAIDLNRGNTVKTRTRDAYGIWNEWSEIGGSSYELPVATVETIGGVKLGTQLSHSTLGDLSMIPISLNNNNQAVFQADAPFSANSGRLNIQLGTGLYLDEHKYLAIDLVRPSTIPTEGIKIVPLSSGTCPNDSVGWGALGFGVPVDPEVFTLKKAGLTLKDGAGVTKVTWGETSDMNDFKTAGVYEIYGERTVKTDNLPISNDGSGHSIAARLTVVASTLQPNNTEICVTQLLQLSNRIGGEGNTYIRTYNENNNGLNGWSPWQKQMGMVETYINTNDTSINSSGVLLGTGVDYGLNGMTDNGMYSGIYTDYLPSPTFFETFVLVVINDYAASGQLNLPRHITQLKYAVDAIMGQSTVKKRVGTGSDSISWGDWEEIGGGGSNEVDITDAVKTYGLPTLVAQGLAKEGVTYKVVCQAGEVPSIDNNGKIPAHIDNHRSDFDDIVTMLIKVQKKPSTYSEDTYAVFIDCTIVSSGESSLYKYIISNINTSYETVKVSVDMTEL